MPVQTSLVSPSSKQSGCLRSTTFRHYLISILISIGYELFEGGAWQWSWKTRARGLGSTCPYLGSGLHGSPFVFRLSTLGAGASTLGAGKGRRPAIRRPTRQVWGVSIAFPPPDIALLPPLPDFIPSCNKPTRIRVLSDKVTQHVARASVITRHHRLPLIGHEAINHEGFFTPSLEGTLEINRRVHHHGYIRVHVNASRTGARNDCLRFRLGCLTTGHTEKE